MSGYDMIDWSTLFIGMCLGCCLFVPLTFMAIWLYFISQFRIH